MFIISSGSVIALVLIQITTSQNIPEECQKPPPYVEKPLECCQVPQFFKDEDLEACGFQKRPSAPPPPPQLRGAPQGKPFEFPQGPPPCDKQLCLLSKYGLVNDSSLDYQRIGQFMDDYSAVHPPFSPAVEQAKAQCLTGDLARFGPPQICDAMKLFMCTSSILFAECPEWGEAEACSGLKQHIDKCKGFIFQ